MTDRKFTTDRKMMPRCGDPTLITGMAERMSVGQDATNGGTPRDPLASTQVASLRLLRLACVVAIALGALAVIGWALS